MKRIILAVILNIILLSIYPQEKRLALVIGNSDYQYGWTLANPVNDARSMVEILKKIGFTVYEYENLDQNHMKNAISDFGAKLKGIDIGLFYYAGHGIQAKEFNYLIPVDAEINSEEEVDFFCVRADMVLAFMEKSATKVNVIILDACRNNPFERSWTRSATGRGLVFMNAPNGTLIAYATSPGNTASDGSGRNSPYTSALLESIQIPNITISQMFQNVNNIVSTQTNKRQTPWYSSSLSGDFYFNPTIALSEEIQNKTKPVTIELINTDYVTDSFVDPRDNITYKTVKIGNQVWMAENLNYFSKKGSKAYDDKSYVEGLGRLYTWETAKAVCPSGWHLPDNKDWVELRNYLGGERDAGNKMKETGAAHWRDGIESEIIENEDATNESGFNALPDGAGYSSLRYYKGTGWHACWWSATENNFNKGWYCLLISSFNMHESKGREYNSVRCIKN